jgi:hypothetical protein
MPVDIEKETTFTDRNGEKLSKHIRDGMTIITPVNPVSITHYREKLERFGFNRFLIDMSFVPPSKENIQTLVTDFREGNAIKGSAIFNFKRELK